MGLVRELYKKVLLKVEEPTLITAIGLGIAIPLAIYVYTITPLKELYLLNLTLALIVALTTSICFMRGE